MGRGFFYCFKLVRRVHFSCYLCSWSIIRVIAEKALRHTIPRCDSPSFLPRLSLRPVTATKRLNREPRATYTSTNLGFYSSLFSVKSGECAASQSKSTKENGRIDYITNKRIAEEGKSHRVALHQTIDRMCIHSA